MKTCKYNFSDLGIKAMYHDSLEMIWDAMEGENPDFSLDELDINITIGDKKIIVPLHADSFEMLFECLEKINGSDQ